MSSCCKGICWNAPCRPVLHASDCSDGHSIPACQKYMVLGFTQNERHHGVGQRKNLCMNEICAVHSGKIDPGSVRCYMRKHSFPHLKGYKICLLSIFPFWFHLTKLGILLQHLFWRLSYWDPERMLQCLCLSPTTSVPWCRTTLKLMGSCTLNIIDSEKVCQGVTGQWERTGKRPWGSPGPRLKGKTPYYFFFSPWGTVVGQVLTRRQESEKYLYLETFQNCLGEVRKKSEIAEAEEIALGQLG